MAEPFQWDMSEKYLQQTRVWKLLKISTGVSASKKYMLSPCKENKTGGMEQSEQWGVSEELAVGPKTCKLWEQKLGAVYLGICNAQQSPAHYLHKWPAEWTKMATQGKEMLQNEQVWSF